MSTTPSAGRIVSMDQFRGYTVAGMFLVNFVGSLAAFHAVLKHNNTYFSYADTIMPSFIFAVGFSYRLTFIRRLPQIGYFKTAFTYFRRSIALILVSLMVFGFDNGFSRWNQFNTVPRGIHKSSDSENDKATEAKKEESKRVKLIEEYEKKDADEQSVFEVEVPERFAENWKVFALKLIKADMWEVLVIIAVCQIFILPVIAARWWIRVLAMIGCGAGHAVMSYYFNWDFVHAIGETYRISSGEDLVEYARDLTQITQMLGADAAELVRGMKDTVVLPDGKVVDLLHGSWMNEFWGLKGSTGWDGGFFGIVSWAVAMLAGTLVYDLMSTKLPGKAATWLLVWGTLMMLSGYGMSCLTTLYDLKPLPGAQEVAEIQKKLKADIKDVKRSAAVKLKTFSDDDDDDVARIEKETDAKIAELTKDGNARIQEIHEKNAEEENQEEIERINKINDGRIDERKGSLAKFPVKPPLERFEGRSWMSRLAEPPFMEPPSTNPADLQKGEPVRLKNYWMMGKRLVSLSFITCSTGFAILVYGLFVLACDIGPIRIGLFRTFGMNPLAAYVIHEVVMNSTLKLVPKDSPLWYASAGFVVFFAIVYLFVRHLEKHNIYIRM